MVGNFRLEGADGQAAAEIEEEEEEAAAAAEDTKGSRDVAVSAPFALAARLEFQAR